jgi:NAD(P)H-nitrite reductase large subunit
MQEKRKLVVIGNGMAGARTVEETLARGGGDQFDITMFGEEPTGNYNRILLSNVLNGSYKEDEIFLNPLDWYRETTSACSRAHAPREFCAAPNSSLPKTAPRSFTTS